MAITGKRRIAIYLRDGLACVYCTRVMEVGMPFTIDHFIPKSQGGSSEQANLVTSCSKCNGMKQDKGVGTFLRDHISGADGNHLAVIDRIAMLTSKDMAYYREMSRYLIDEYGYPDAIPVLRRKMIRPSTLEFDEIAIADHIYEVREELGIEVPEGCLQ